MFPKRLLALTLFAALAVMPPCVLRAEELSLLKRYFLEILFAYDKQVIYYPV